jgi:hypothetical protein
MGGAGYWQQVRHRGLAVPADRSLEDLTAELARLLGSTDPVDRDGTAYPTLTTWIERGVYDDLLSGLGDGIAVGLLTGLGEQGTDTVFRRSFSALVLAECLRRDHVVCRVPGAKVLEWGDRIASWYLRERDVRGYVPGKGWAHTLAHGADALAVLARSPHLGTPELTVLLDVLADRVLLASPPWVHGEPDRLAYATLEVLRRNLAPFHVVEPWVARIAAAADHRDRGASDPYASSANPQQYLRSLHLQVTLAPDQPADRPDLLLCLVDALRATNRAVLT